MTDGTNEIETSDAEDGSNEDALLYAIVQVGVYRHDIGGVFTSIEKACAEVEIFMLDEKDHYHDWQILEFKPDAAVDDGKLACTATWDYCDNIPALKFEDGYSI